MLHPYCIQIHFLTLASPITPKLLASAFTMNTQHPLQEQMMSSSDGQQQQQQIDWNAALGGAGGMGMGMGMQQLPNELIGSMGGAVMSPQQGNMDGGQQFNPQLLLEQQFKLTQLQQLQQLQNQIFQQQVCGVVCAWLYRLY